MNHLEALIVEYLEWQGYIVRKNIKIGKLSHGGWSMEIDVVGYRPANESVPEDLVHYESSIDAHSWDVRERRFKKKFSIALQHIKTDIFPWLGSSICPIRQVAVLISHPKNRHEIAGARIQSIDELLNEVGQKIRIQGPVARNAIPETYPLLRTIQFIHCGYYKAL
ncbi:MAG: hypothetical protein ABL882_02950 [Sphingopyxis sp.]